MNKFSDSTTEIISYNDDLKEMLKIINYEWLEKYFQVTKLDKKAFDNPKEEIIDKDGYIYFARFNGEIVGSIALEKLSEKQFVLSRFGVKSGFQGKKIGKLLMDKVMEKANELKIASIILYTNHVLINALNMYYRYGFKAVPMDDVPYKRASIKMEFRFNTD